MKVGILHPAEYRWLLLNFGGCYLAEPWIFTLKELEEAYPIFQEAYEDYMSEYDHGPTFPIGGLGDGSIVFLDLESGRVRGYNCDYTDLEEMLRIFQPAPGPCGTGIGTGKPVQRIVR